MKKVIYAIFFAALIISCNQTSNKSLFELKNNESLGIVFENNLGYSKEFNVYKYRNFYNGGGVSLGDINNDGLTDIYLVSNQNSNHLYLNLGNWKFRDISESSRTQGTKAWSTGVTMVDINSDGFLDIYVCNSGDVKGDNKENELFINNGDLTFTESAAAYNLNDKGFSTHASFFDYDKDGDLDVYILNNSFQAIGSFNLRKNERPNRDDLGGDKLMRNDDGVYVDVSTEAGIYGSVIGFGLGITIGDVNSDSWDDIFISNDFFERDYLYINQQDGTFKEDLVAQMPSISAASMGADIGDINNDGKNEIFVTEMLPSEYERLKTVTTFEDWNRYQYGVQNGYHHQFTRNVLHLNNGDNTFSDISRFAGVDASDWSWGALFFDMDNDGNKDLFIANGIYKDLTNQDYLQYIANESVVKSVVSDEGVDYKKLIDIIPSNKVANHAYKNEGNLQFRKYTESGLMTEGFSNGSAYGDLDNDGDLDLVVNNVNMPCFVYENHADKTTGNNFLKIKLDGEGKNRMGIGSKIKVSSGEKNWYYDYQPTRGFESSVDPVLTIGVGTITSVDVEVTWPLGKISRMKNLEVNQHITISESTAEEKGVNPIISEVKSVGKTGVIPFVHQENKYIDFNREQLNYHMLSTRGPCVSYADINGDGINDLVIPGSKGQLSHILIQDSENQFSVLDQAGIFEKSISAEHVRCELFDADNDGDLDLYLASGGVELTKYSDLLYDQLLINSGDGKFEESNQKFPATEMRTSTSAVTHSDFDQDGDLDLFIGERVKVGEYGASCSGFLLENDGLGQFTDVTSRVCPDLTNIGMITDADFVDFDQDGLEDLVVVGEFMEVCVFKNNGKGFEKIHLQDKLSGWWNVLKAVDIDNDGDQDIVIGNHGLNSRFKASTENPISLYFNDFDKNGFPEGIMTKRRENGKDYPYALRQNLVGRLPYLKKKFPDFESYKTASINDIFSQQEIEGSEIKTVNELRSLILVNEGNFRFSVRFLPLEAQLSPVFAIAAMDINHDGFLDLLIGGNLYNVQPEVGRYDASYGSLLINDKSGNFSDQSDKYGFKVKGEIRDFVVDGNKVHVFRNNDSVVSFEFN